MEKKKLLAQKVGVTVVKICIQKSILMKIKRHFFEKIDIEVDKNNIDKADGEWFRFRVIEKYWRLKEPDNNSNGFCEVYYRIEYYNK